MGYPRGSIGAMLGVGHGHVCDCDATAEAASTGGEVAGMARANASSGSRIHPRQSGAAR